MVSLYNTNSFTDYLTSLGIKEENIILTMTEVIVIDPSMVFTNDEILEYSSYLGKNRYCKLIAKKYPELLI